MYKLLLVDDNQFVLDGFREKINLGDLGIELSAVAANGEEALCLAGAVQPDIIVTDIKMPRMDGMALLEAVAKSGRSVKTVILSGYSDFEYARRAISLNAVEYLLKPILKTDIEACLARIVQELKNRDEEARRKSRQEDQLRQSSGIVKSHLITGLLEGKAETLCDDRLAAVCPALFAGPVAAVVVERDRVAAGAEGMEPMALLLGAVECALPGCAGVVLGERRTALLLPAGPTRAAALAALRRVYAEACRLAAGPVSVAAGEPAERPDGIHRSYLQAVEAMGYRLIWGGGAVLPHWEVVCHGGKSARFDQSLKKALDIAAQGKREATMAALDEFYGGIATHRDCRPADVTGASNRLALCSLAILRGEGGSLCESALWEQLNTLETLEDVRGWIKGVFERAHSAADERSRFSHIVNRVIDVVDRDYAKDLLLKDIADELFISTNYLTTLFRKETGVTFKKYMTGVRVRKAMELLRDPQYKVYQIAGLIGYESEEHFSRVFKETTGLTPREYKNGGSPARQAVQ